MSVCYPWGLMRHQGSRLLCADGKIRAAAYLASTPDTFFSTPAAVKIAGKRISGFMTLTESFVPPKFDRVRRAFVFVPNADDKNNTLPKWPGSFSQELFDLLAAGEETESSKNRSAAVQQPS